MDKRMIHIKLAIDELADIYITNDDDIVKIYTLCNRIQNLIGQQWEADNQAKLDELKGEIRA